MKAYGRNRRKEKRRLIAAAAALAAVVLAAALVIYLSDKSIEEKAESNNSSTQPEVFGDESLGIDAGVDEQLKDYRIIGILGIDNGGRSDIIMAVSINRKTNEAKIVTVHRDTYMQISPDEPYIIDGVEREFYKCNRAYKQGGMTGAMTELNRHMDLNMREMMTIDWDGTEKVVNSLGGVEVTIDDDLRAAMNQSLDAANQVPEGNPVLLNGKQAVTYLRARKYSGGSAPVRESRDKEFVSSLFRRAQNMTAEELIGIYDSALSGIDSTMSRSVLVEALAEIHDMELEETDEWPYEYTIMWQNDDSYYYFVADTLETNVTELHKTLFDQEDYVPAETVRELSSRIEELRKTELY